MQADVLGQNVISCFEFVDARLCMMHLDVARPQALAARPQALAARRQGTSRVLRLSSKVASVGGKTPMDEQSAETSFSFCKRWRQDPNGQAEFSWEWL